MKEGGCTAFPRAITERFGNFIAGDLDRCDVPIKLYAEVGKVAMFYDLLPLNHMKGEVDVDSYRIECNVLSAEKWAAKQRNNSFFYFLFLLFSTR